MTKDEEISKLKAALEWALGEGANGSLEKGALRLYDSGCGCCSGKIEPPEELRAVIVDVLTP